MTIKAYHTSDYPRDHKILYQRNEIAGLAHYKDAAQKFVRARRQYLEWETEPDNPHDKHAIVIFGCSKGFFHSRRDKLGYVPATLAAELHARGLVDKAAPRLLKTYMTDSGFVEILFEISGPREYESDRQRYKRAKKRTEPAGETRQSDETLEQWVRRLIRQGHLETAKLECLSLIQDAEREEATAPVDYMVRWYELLAEIFKKERAREDELAVLEKLERSPHWDEHIQARIIKRVKKLREMIVRRKA